MSKSFPYAFWDAWEWNLYYQPKQSTSIMGYPSKWPCLCCLFDSPPIRVAFNDPCTIQEWKTRMIKPEKWVLVHLRMASILESFTQYLHEVWIWTSCQIPKWWKKTHKTSKTSTSLKVLVLLQERFPLYTPNCSSREALQQVWQLLSHLGTSSYFQLPLDACFLSSVSSQRWQIKASKNKGQLESFC